MRTRVRSLPVKSIHLPSAQTDRRSVAYSIRALLILFCSSIHACRLPPGLGTWFTLTDDPGATTHVSSILRWRSAHSSAHTWPRFPDVLDWRDHFPQCEYQHARLGCFDGHDLTSVVHLCRFNVYVPNLVRWFYVPDTLHNSDASPIDGAGCLFQVRLQVIMRPRRCLVDGGDKCKILSDTVGGQRHCAKQAWKRSL